MRLEAKEVSFTYKGSGRKVLDHVSLVVQSGERVGLMAPSGFGKTTLLKLLAGYERPASGEILLDGRPLTEYHGYCPVQMVWQHPELAVNPRRRLKTVLEEADWTKEEAAKRSRIEKALGIKAEWWERFPAEVSGGELQRFCIARALGRRTRILLADEITTMLDLVTQAELFSFLRRELSRREIGLVAVSHSQELLQKVCSRIIRLDEGGKEIGTN